jgi:hypothetical protein
MKKTTLIIIMLSFPVCLFSANLSIAGSLDVAISGINTYIAPSVSVTIYPWGKVFGIGAEMGNFIGTSPVDDHLSILLLIRIGWFEIGFGWTPSLANASEWDYSSATEKYLKCGLIIPVINFNESTVGIDIFLCMFHIGLPKNYVWPTAQSFNQALGNAIFVPTAKFSIGLTYSYMK